MMQKSTKVLGLLSSDLWMIQAVLAGSRTIHHQLLELVKQQHGEAPGGAEQGRQGRVRV